MAGAAGGRLGELASAAAGGVGRRRAGRARARLLAAAAGHRAGDLYREI